MSAFHGKFKHVAGGVAAEIPAGDVNVRVEIPLDILTATRPNYEGVLDEFAFNYGLAEFYFTTMPYKLGTFLTVQEIVGRSFGSLVEAERAKVKAKEAAAEALKEEAGRLVIETTPENKETQQDEGLGEDFMDEIFGGEPKWD